MIKIRLYKLRIKYQCTLICRTASFVLLSMAQIHWVWQNLLQKMFDIPNFVFFFSYMCRSVHKFKTYDVLVSNDLWIAGTTRSETCKTNCHWYLQKSMPSSWTDAWSSMHQRLDEKLDNQIDSSSLQDFTGHNEGIKMNRTWKNRVWHITILCLQV
jgi:hypothetical protein